MILQSRDISGGWDIRF